MSNELGLMYIKKDADNIREQMEDCHLYGISMDFDNLDMIILAAYWVGRINESKDHLMQNTGYLDQLDKEK